MKNKIIIALSLLATTLGAIATIPQVSATSEKSVQTSIEIHKKEIPTVAVTLTSTAVSGYAGDVLSTDLTIQNHSSVPIYNYLTKMKVSDQSTWKPTLISDPSYVWDSSENESNELMMGAFSYYSEELRAAFSDGTKFKEYRSSFHELESFIQDSNSLPLSYLSESGKDTFTLFFKTNTNISPKVADLIVESTIRISPYLK